MNIYQDLEDSLYALIITLFPTWTVIFPYQNGPEPTTPYMLIDVKWIDQVGREQTSTTVTLDINQAGATTTILQNYQAKVRFEFIGLSDVNSTLQEMSQELLMMLRTPLGYETQHTQNLSLYTMSQIERLTLTRETKTYMSYQLDTTFGYAVQMITDQDWIESTTISGVYDAAGREPDHKIVSTITI